MQNTSKPWYCEPWPWFLIMLPLSAVIASVITIWLAVQSQDGLVADDYYKQGMAINQTLHRDQAAQRLGISAELSLNNAVLRVRLSARQPVAPEQLQLHLIHPTQPGRDQHLALQKSEQSIYVFVIKDNNVEKMIRSQHWRLILDAPEADWRLTGFWSAGMRTMRLGV